MTRKRKTVRSVPRALIRDWLEGIGADHVIIQDGASTTSKAVVYAAERVERLGATHVVIHAFGLRARVFNGREAVAVLHTPTAAGEVIRWEQIA